MTTSPIATVRKIPTPKTGTGARPWTEAEKALVRAEYPTCPDRESLAARLGRSVESLKRVVRLLRLRREPGAKSLAQSRAGSRAADWSAREDRLLARLWREGAGWAEVRQALPGRSKSGIENRAYRLALPPRRGGGAGPKRGEARGGGACEARMAPDEAELARQRLAPPVPPAEEARRARARQLAAAAAGGPVPLWLLRQQGWLESSVRAVLAESGEWFEESAGCLGLSEAGRKEFGERGR